MELDPNEVAAEISVLQMSSFMKRNRKSDETEKVKPVENMNISIATGNKKRRKQCKSKPKISSKLTLSSLKRNFAQRNGGKSVTASKKNEKVSCSAKVDSSRKQSLTVKSQREQKKLYSTDAMPNDTLPELDYLNEPSIVNESAPTSVPSVSETIHQSPNSRRPVCIYWSKGKCANGHQCSFYHPPALDRRIICKHFARRFECNRGDSCSFSHQLDAVPCRFLHSCLDGCRQYNDWKQNQSGTESTPCSCPFYHGPIDDLTKKRLVLEHQIRKKKANGLDCTALETELASLEKEISLSPTLLPLSPNLQANYSFSVVPLPAAKLTVSQDNNNKIADAYRWSRQGPRPNREATPVLKEKGTNLSNENENENRHIIPDWQSFLQ